MSLKKKEREKEVLLGLVEFYLLTGKPVGSNTLKENKFDGISSATIRNYFSKLEKEGFLHQHHSSGGRTPSLLAYRFYADHHCKQKEPPPHDLDRLQKELNQDTREIAAYLQHASELLSELTEGAVFLSSPRFDQDLIIEVKFLNIDAKRCMCVLITDFGLVRTEVLHAPKKLSRFSLKRIEAYFRFRMTGLDRPHLSKIEDAIAANFYKEILLRHIVNHTNFSSEDIYKTGFSKLLAYPEFRDATTLATGLSLFENTTYMRALLDECIKTGKLQFWIGNSLEKKQDSLIHSSVIAIPYFIRGKPVGALALLIPIRAPYPKLFGIMHACSTILSDVLTRNLYKYKITYRQTSDKQISQSKSSTKSLDQKNNLRIEVQN